MTDSTPLEPLQADSMETRPNGERDKVAWKVVEARVDQLKDAAAEARTPFVFGLIFSFCWLVAMYNHEMGYIATSLQRVEQDQLAVAGDPSVSPDGAVCPCSTKTIKRYHPHLYDGEQAGSLEATPCLGNRQTMCREILVRTQTRLVDRQVDSWMFTIPAIGIDTTIFDLSLIGQLGTLLIASWLYFASRRENDAMNGFVVFDPGDPTGATLLPARSFLGCRHYYYAFQAIAQRFLFLTPRRHRASFLFTSALILFLLAPSLWNTVLNVKSVRQYELYDVSWRAALSLLFCAASTLLITLGCLRLQHRTSKLLNAWFLANRDVWGTEPCWDSTPAPAVQVDFRKQSAKELE